MKTFTLCIDHITLLRHAYVSWERAEFGAPGINPKRPYGNSDVYADMVKILGLDAEATEYRDFDPALREILDGLHRDTETALQIVLRCRTFAPGIYVAEDYTNNWRPVQQDAAPPSEGAR